MGNIKKPQLFSKFASRIFYYVFLGIFIFSATIRFIIIRDELAGTIIPTDKYQCSAQISRNAATDKWMRCFKDQNIPFEAQETMDYTDAKIISIKLSESFSSDSIPQRFKAIGIGNEIYAKNSIRMKAYLKGRIDFVIEDITKAVSVNYQSKPAEWKWRISPKHGGESKLFFLMYLAQVGENLQDDIEIFSASKTIFVEKSWLDKLTEFLDKFQTYALIGTIFGAIGLVLQIKTSSPNSNEKN